MIRSSHGGTTTRAKSTSTTKKPAAHTGAPARPTRTPGPRSRRDGATIDAPKGVKKAAGKIPAAPASSDGRGLAASAVKVPSGVSTASDAAREMAVLIAVAAIEKKASGLEVIDVAGRVDYADFLVLMSGRSDRHVTALSSAIEDALRKKNKRALAVEGLPHASWVLMDFGDVVVHVFQDDARAAYDIDGLWMDARRVPVPISEPRTNPIG